MMDTWPSTVAGWIAFISGIILLTMNVVLPWLFWLGNKALDARDWIAERRAREEKMFERPDLPQYRIPSPDDIEHQWHMAQQHIEHARELAEFDRLLARPPQRYSNAEIEEGHIVSQPEPNAGFWSGARLTVFSTGSIYYIPESSSEDRPPRERDESKPASEWDAEHDY